MIRDGGHSWRKALLGGLAVAVAPVLGLNVLLAVNFVTASQRDADGVAAEALGFVEERLDNASAAVIALALKGVSDCEPAEATAVQAAWRRAPQISEIAVVDAAGAATCSALGTPRVVRRASAEHEAISPELALSTVTAGENGAQRFIRLQWRYPAGDGLRALVPGDQLFPKFLRARGSAAFAVQVVMLDGPVVARRLLDPALAEPQPSIIPSVHAASASSRYPIRVDVDMPGGAISQANKSLFVYANLSGLLFAALTVAGAVLLSRRSGGPVREIHDGIRRGEFIPYYQPVIDIVTGRLTGCEVLVRWRKRDGSIVPPGRFISLAEASGEIFPMTLALMEAARDDLAAFYCDRPHLKLGFNLFAGHFDDVTIADEVEAIFSGSSIRMGQLMFEVTERQPLHDIRRARQVIARLQDLGARVALDDVGTGHGGLSYLLKLGVDVMKMDKMFVDAIGTDRYSVAIVDSLVKLAEDMNLDLIAEGVETIEQVEYLRAKGVRLAQGYVFAPPLPASSFLALVEAMAPLAREVEDAPRRLASA